jgi:hypothetical protein
MPPYCAPVLLRRVNIATLRMQVTQGFCPKAAPAGVDSMHPLAGVPFYTTR